MNLAVHPDAEFVLNNADRLITVTTRCVISFGPADGLNEFLLAGKSDRHEDWRQAIWCFQRDGLLMAALPAALLLDADERVLSFQTVYHRLEKPDVQATLLQMLEGRHGPDDISPSRAELIEEFRGTYREIDWKAHGRLVHFRNRGIAHPTPEKMLKSITLVELRRLIEIISRLATTLQHLCQVQTAFHPDLLDEYRELAKRTFKP
jgi:hypothetical protein